MDEKHPRQRATERLSRLPSARLVLAGRLVWGAFAALAFVLFARGVPVVVGEIEHCGGNDCPITGLRFSPGSIPSANALRWMAIYMVSLEGATLLILCGLSIVLLRRQADQWIALVASFMLVGFGGVVFNPTITEGAAQGKLSETLTTFIGFAGSAAIIPFLCMLPDGHFVPRWTRWVAAAWVLVCVIGYYAPPAPFFAAVNNDSNSVGMPLLGMFFFVATVIGQTRRYRVYANYHQQQQIKWVVGGTFSSLALLLLTLLAPPALGIKGDGYVAHIIGNTMMNAIQLMIPASIVVAIVKTRLWDIDRIINRALVFGGLSASLIGVYVGTVLLFQRLFNPLTGESHLTVAVSTLLVAALFNPARRRIQAIVDRRFYRQKYNAGQALASFGIAARDEVDLERLTGVLADVISETVQPTHLTVWLRDHEPRPFGNRERAS